MVGIKAILNKILNIINAYTEVGSIYITTKTVDEFNPNVKFGGTWSLIQGRMLIGAGDLYAVKSTGGYADESVIYHRHKIGGTVWSNGSGGKYSCYKTSSNRKRVLANTDYTGVAVTQKNLPPYYVVNIWRRTS